MEQELVRFTVRILSAENGGWQGVVETEKEAYRFESELQLLRWLHQKYPALLLKKGF